MLTIRQGVGSAMIAGLVLTAFAGISSAVPVMYPRTLADDGSSVVSSTQAPRLGLVLRNPEPAKSMANGYPYGTGYYAWTLGPIDGATEIARTASFLTGLGAMGSLVTLTGLAGARSPGTNFWMGDSPPNTAKAWPAAVTNGSADISDAGDELLAMGASPAVPATPAIRAVTGSGTSRATPAEPAVPATPADPTHPTKPAPGSRPFARPDDPDPGLSGLPSGTTPGTIQLPQPYHPTRPQIPLKPDLPTTPVNPLRPDHPEPKETPDHPAHPEHPGNHDGEGGCGGGAGGGGSGGGGYGTGGSLGSGGNPKGGEIPEPGTFALFFAAAYAALILGRRPRS